MDYMVSREQCPLVVIVACFTLGGFSTLTVDSVSAVLTVHDDL